MGPRAVSGLRGWRFSGVAPRDSPDTEVVRGVLEAGSVHRRRAVRSRGCRGVARHVMRTSTNMPGCQWTTSKSGSGRFPAK